MTGSAFTTVAARRTFGRPSIVEAPKFSEKPPTKKIDWPTPVREYVQRCFIPENAIPGIYREEMEAMLKKVITDAAESNALQVLDWETLPLPQQMIHNERNQSKLSGVVMQSQAVQEGFSGTNGATSKKRKTPEPGAVGDETKPLPPWRNSNIRNGIEDRISYPTQGQADRADKKQRKTKHDIVGKDTSKFNSNLEKRKQRFENGKAGFQSPLPHHSYRDASPTLEVSQGPILGTCQNLEKNYFRLTSPPKAETVRPLHVLERTLDLLKLKWKAENNYSYICDQFKSLRQDLTVQHIKNEFTVNVYEIHARIALEKGDLGEYNQCQTQLRALYSQKLGGHPAEFVAYRILYLLHTCNRTDMNDLLADLTPADKEQYAVKHALEVRSALALGNYHNFFRLYLITPNMGGYLMDMFIVRERLAALANICKAYKPDVTVRFLTEELGFESDQDCAQFLIDCNAQHLLEQKDETVRMATGKAGSLFDIAKTTAFRRVDIKGQL